MQARWRHETAFFLDAGRRDELHREKCNHYRRIVASSVPNYTQLRLVIVPWSTLYRARVRNDSVLASTRGPAVRPQFLRELPEPSGSEQASGIIMTAWAGGAVEQPTITGRTRRAPDSIQPLFACADCTFVDQCIAPGVQKKDCG